MGEDRIDEIMFEDLTEEEVREVQAIFQRFINKYKENPDKDSAEWLVEQLHEELPDRSSEEIQEMVREIIESVEEYDRDLEDLDKSCKAGGTKQSWFADRIQDSAKGVAVNQFGDSLLEIDQTLAMANAQMERVILTNDGEISQCPNLDGFIAEQYHVNNFNAKAIMENSPYRARVCVPEGETYGKNSVDVMIDNVKTNQKGVLRYQFKFGKDSQATVNMLEKGDYSNQRIVVPKDQVEAVQEVYPNKSVTDYIGGNEKVNIKSDAVSKEQIKQMQADAQGKQLFPKMDWNSYETRELALGIGRRAGNAGVQAAFLGMGISLVHKSIQGEKIEADEVIETALATGSDTFVKSAAGGALKVASEKGILAILPPGTPAGTIAKFACVGIENVKILWKVAKGELTMTQALEQMGRTSVAMYAGLTAGAVGAAAGAAALSWIPIVGPLVGGVVGGMAGYMAGNKFGETIYNGAKNVFKKGKEIVKKGIEKVKEGVGGIARKIRDLLLF